MDIFYVLVLSIAIMLLILILTYIGIKMAYNKDAVGQNAYPPQFSNCPDYWQTNIDGTCVIPNSGGKNYGSINAGNPSSCGTNTQKNAIDFSAACWNTSGSSVCSKQLWSKMNNVSWDGISNYNGCT